jgi:hypothetical protein
MDSLALDAYDFAIAVNEANLNRAFYLPRLPREYYQGDAVVHWTLPVSHRRRGWLDERFHSAFRELVLHTAAREGLFCPTYCLMPDHLHLVWTGLRLDSDQLNGTAFLRTHLEPKLTSSSIRRTTMCSRKRNGDEMRLPASAITSSKIHCGQTW